MKHPQEYSLIEGVFSHLEAKEVLFALIESKISFHEKKIFSHKMRMGHTHVQSEIRIQKLKQTKEEIKKILDSASRYGDDIKIDSKIHIQIV
jgi:hypothetical protein